MTRRSIAFVLVLLGAVIHRGDAIAGPNKVMVLPLDGNADAATRTKLSASVQRLARVLEGKVVPGTTTFADSATVIGCDPSTPACANDVRTTLGVDELVYGTVTAQNGQLVVVVRRTMKGKPPREVSTTLGAHDPPERAEAAILPLFNAAPVEPIDPKDPKDPKDGAIGTPPNGNPGNPGDPGNPPPPIVDQPRTRFDRTLGIAAAAGGGTMLLIGFALWSNASGLQDQVDSANPMTHDDFVALVELEDKTSTRAWVGNGMVLAGLALGAYGGWLLYKDHKAQRMLVTPTAVEGGGGITLTLLGGL